MKKWLITLFVLLPTIPAIVSLMYGDFTYLWYMIPLVVVLTEVFYLLRVHMAKDHRRTFYWKSEKGMALVVSVFVLFLYTSIANIIKSLLELLDWEWIGRAIRYILEIVTLVGVAIGALVIVAVLLGGYLIINKRMA